MEEQEQSAKQKAIIFATSENVQGAIELLQKSRTHITNILADTEYKTVVNAIVLETETQLIQRFVALVENIRQGNNLNEQQ